MKKLLALTLAALMVFGMVACASNTDSTPADTSAPADSQTTEQADASAEADASTEADASSESTEQADAPAETLIFGTSADYAPFEFMYPDDNGDMVYGGIDVADYTGKTLQTENMAFDYLLASLQKGDFDIVIAAMEATDERKEAADFSDPYYTDYPPMILVKKENADQYKTLADFDAKADIVTNDMPGANLVALQLVTDLVNQLMYDKVDAVVVDGSVANQYVAENDDFVIAEASSELGAAEPYCVAVQKGDPKGLLPGINEAIAKINSENKIEEFISLADSLSGVAEEVSDDAPAE